MVINLIPSTCFFQQMKRCVVWIPSSNLPNQSLQISHRHPSSNPRHEVSDCRLLLSEVLGCSNEFFSDSINLATSTFPYPHNRVSAAELHCIQVSRTHQKPFYTRSEARLMALHVLAVKDCQMTELLRFYFDNLLLMTPTLV